MSRPASSSGVYGLTDAIVGTLDRMRKVGMISNNDAITTAPTVATVKSSHLRSQARCHAIPTKWVHTPAAGGAATGSAYSRGSGGASMTATAYVAGLRRHVIRMFHPHMTVPTMYSV